MKKTVIISLATSILMFFNSCAEREFDITGTWKLEKAEIYIEGNIAETVKDTGEELTFYPDGTGKSGSFSFNWELTEGALFMIEHQQQVKYIIKEKSVNKLVLKDSEPENKLGEVEVLTLIKK